MSGEDLGRLPSPRLAAVYYLGRPHASRREMSSYLLCLRNALRRQPPLGVLRLCVGLAVLDEEDHGEMNGGVFSLFAEPRLLELQDLSIT